MDILQDKMYGILDEAKTIAVVGVSQDSKRVSNKIFKYLDEYYEVIPVNPFIDKVYKKISYKDIPSIKQDIDIINIFRPSDEVYGIVKSSLVKKPGTIWMQLGIKDKRAKELALDHGIKVIMDRCIMREHKRYLDSKKKTKGSRSGHVK